MASGWWLALQTTLLQVLLKPCEVHVSLGTLLVADKVQPHPPLWQAIILRAQMVCPDNVADIRQCLNDQCEVGIVLSGRSAAVCSSRIHIHIFEHKPVRHEGFQCRHTSTERGYRTGVLASCAVKALNEVSYLCHENSSTPLVQ